MPGPFLSTLCIFNSSNLHNDPMWKVHYCLHILFMVKLRLKEVKPLVQDHREKKKSQRGSGEALEAVKPMLLTTAQTCFCMKKQLK